MRRRLSVLLAAVVLAGPLVAAASADPTAAPATSNRPAAAAEGLVDVAGLTATVAERSVVLTWEAAPGSHDLQVLRDGQVMTTLPAGSTTYDDAAVTPGATYGYRVAQDTPGRRPSTPVVVPVTLPAYLVGAANTDITPEGVVNVGGFGVGDGSVVPEDLLDPGNRAEATAERVRARAMVVDDGTTAIAIANLELTGHFAAYSGGEWGLEDMSERIAAANPRLPVSNILLASNHTHSGPDTLGVWGGPPPGYLDLVRDRLVEAVLAAYEQRQLASLRAGQSDASDLIYNQSCTEALNQSKEPAYPGPEVCATPGKDGMFRVVQASAPSGKTVLTWATYAAHATAGGGSGIHGDWPAFLSDAMATDFGGEGLAMVGALGGTQPCRPSCAFTHKDNPGYELPGRREAVLANYGRHVRLALASATEVTGPVAAQRGYIREAITGPAMTALFVGGKHLGIDLLRSTEPPWVNAQTLRTVVGAMRIGGLAVVGTPGEGYPRIGDDVRAALQDEQMVIQLGLAGDTLGYLISPAEYYPVIAAQFAVNNNALLNVSATLGDHVGCADTRLALALGFAGQPSPECLAYDVVDSAGDPVGAVPVGGIVLP